MKRIILLFIGAMMGCAVFAQIVEQDEPAIVYYSPKTSVVVEFSYTIEKQEAGVFAQYAKELLGTDNAIKETKTTYVLDKARILTATTTDYSRPHKVVNDPSFPLLLSINEKQVLVGYNAPQTEVPESKNTSKDAKNEKPHADKLTVAPYPEEVVKASKSSADEASAIAQQIFHLREMRTYLLSGEVEHAPADGKSMELVLNELAKQEQALTELFVGKKTIRYELKEMRFDPTYKEEKQWFFSAENGFTDAENIDAEPITVTTVLYPQKYAATEEDPKAKKKPVALTQIVYNLPGSGDVKVVYKGAVLAKRTLSIAQIGVDVPLAKDIFTGKELPVILFNEKTGNIISISK